MNKKKINYKNIINLPKLNFPMKANLNIKELIILKEWKKNNLYLNIKDKKKKTFIIHDGPPYANGNIHIGHAYNKILKDIILKYKIFMNFNINYIPGWDCHGLPIELKIKKKKKNINKKKYNNYFKKLCFKYVNSQIKKQKNNFIRLGILGDWNNYYKTMDFKTISNTIKVLNKLIKLNYIERKKIPTNWCTKCKSSLAEAEIEYKNKLSKSVYILFNIYDKKSFLKRTYLNYKKYINYNFKLIIWTTTPWTLPGNCAITINPKYTYSFIKKKKNVYILLNNKIKEIVKKTKINYKNIYSSKGKIFNNLYVYHPISKKKVPIILDLYIKKNLGTGIIHIASEHGQEDYKISKKNNIKGLNVIKKNGRFIKYKYINNIENTNINNAEKLIINKLKKNKKLILEENIIHKYPYCWRHKKPILLKSTSQWFININKNNLKKKLLISIKKVKWIPKWGYKKIKKMIVNRPDWCISRQRIWGTPIPIFINKKTKKMHPKTNYLIKKILKNIKKTGPIYWNNINKKILLGKKYKKYKKVKDVLDVWFDSGATCFTIINSKFKKNKISDIYLEGSDQFRGWFMSSLIINTAINNCAPYKKVISHGFILNKNNEKMSKSLNNYIKPKEIIKTFGSDILRLWVSSTKFYKDINISNEIILRTVESYRKIRNTIKFLISNLDNKDIIKNKIKKKNIILIDKWIIHKTKKLQKKIIYLYNKFKFYKITKKIINFCNIYLSSIYLNIIKDRKYIIKKNTKPYNSLQITIWMILESLVKWISPILSFTSEEVFKYLPNKKNKSIYKETWFNKLFYLNKNNKINENIWKKLIYIKNNFNKILEKKKNKKKIKSSLEIELTLYLKKKFFNIIKKIKSELKFFFITSKTNIKILKNKKNKKFFKIKCKKIIGIKCNRCWHYVKKIYNVKKYNICIRCIKNVFGKGEKRKFI